MAFNMLGQEGWVGPVVRTKGDAYYDPAHGTLI